MRNVHIAAGRMIRAQLALEARIDLHNGPRGPDGAVSLVERPAQRGHDVGADEGGRARLAAEAVHQHASVLQPGLDEDVGRGDAR